MGLIYKLGNTIQSLPFPGKAVFSSTTSAVLSLLVSMAMSAVQWHTSWLTHAASLPVIGSLQIILSLLYLATLFLLWRLNWECLGAVIGLIKTVTLCR